MSFNYAFRRLLQMDRPVPPRSDEEIREEVERNYRWNFTVNLLDGASFWMGLSFLSATTIVPLFVSKLTDSPFLIGLVAVIAQGSWFMPQLFTANAVERLARKKPVVINLGFFLERVPFWVIVLAAMAAARRPQLALILFLVSYAWRGFGAGIVATAWQDLLARIFPVERRGRFFGTTMFIGAALGAAGASLSAWILERYEFPTNFVIIFGVAALMITISWLFLSLTREPVQPVTVPRRSNRQFWSELPQILRRDHNFRRFLVGRLLLSLGEMGFGFVTVAAVRQWAVSDSTVGIYTAAYLIGQTLGNLTFGFLADRFGHLLSLKLTGLAAAGSFGLAWLAPAPEWYYLVFVLLGIAVGGIIVSGILVVLEFCPPEKRPTYTGLTNTGAGLVAGAAPLLGAWLASADYAWLFALSAIINLMAFIVLHWWVQEPRWATVGESAEG